MPEETGLVCILYECTGNTPSEISLSGIVGAGVFAVLTLLSEGGEYMVKWRCRLVKFWNPMHDNVIWRFELKRGEHGEKL